VKTSPDEVAVKDILDLKSEQMLAVNPEYQRDAVVWTATQKKKLVDSVLRARVLQDGWVKTTVAQLGCDLDIAAEAIARLLGHPVGGRAGQTIEALAPQEQASAKARSLSVTHGLGSFPMHTDGAHRLQPPRFVVLVCASPGTSPVPTTLARCRDLRISASERARLEAAPFLIRNGRRSFYSTICSRSRPFIRYDAGCMVPQGKDSDAVFNPIAKRAMDARPAHVSWRTGDVLVIDNWDVLHGRGLGSAEASPDRKLLRMSVQ
jgi:Taurine catabolism dioxygenase TauD, TfdA family